MKRVLAVRLPVYVAILAVGGLIVASGSPVWLQICLGVFISATVALSWDILARAGQVSLGQSAFFGIGAYATALLTPSIGLVGAWIAALVLCAAAAMGLGLVTLRLRGMYFSIATVGLTLALQVMVLVFSKWTGGASGISPTPIAAGNQAMQLVYITLFLLIAAFASDLFLSYRLRPALFMIRANPNLAAASGVPIVATKVATFMVSGVLAGLAGAAYGGLYGYVVPTDVFTLQWSVTPVAIAILGGVDSTLGPLIGAFALRGLEEVARNVVGGTGYQVIYGAVITICIVALPAGLVGHTSILIRHLWRRASGGTGTKSTRGDGKVWGSKSPT